jgi:hypothetical protein
MRRTERVIVGVAFFAIPGLLALLFIASYQNDKAKMAFIDACETMGGVAVVGHYGTKACFKSEVLK